LYAKIHVILSKFDNVIEDMQIHVMAILFYFGLKLCTNVKFKYEKGIFDHFFSFDKKSLDLEKIENHV
jgi:hypothetical protein